MRQDAQGLCTGMTVRDGMEREVGGGFRRAGDRGAVGKHMYTCGQLMLMYGKTTAIL